jgi:membrane protein DedA with SNARE-associated domain
LTVGFPIPTIVATGLSRVPIRRWIASLVAGELIKSAILVSVGYIFALSIQQATLGVQVALWIITALVLIAVLIWYKRHHPSIDG